jgi:glycosyltransferase involved in cell wall biosynthesis
MKIAIVTPMFPPKFIGGTEIAAYNIAKHLSRSHDVHVITREQEERLDSGFTTHFVEYVHRPSFMKTLSTALGFFLELKRIRPDVIYAETLFSGGLAGVLAKRLLGIPVISRPVGEIYVAHGLERLIMKFVIRNSSLVLAMTKHMEKEVLKHGKVRTDVLPDGVDYEYFRHFPEQKKIKNSVLFVGRLIGLKGVYDLLEAFRILKVSVPSAKLFIAGYGEEEEGMKTVVEKQGIQDVTFLGKVDKDDVARYMKSCEVLALPSHSEGFPLVIAEAMACGLSIVTTSVRGLPAIVKDGVNGYLVDSGDCERMAEDMTRLLRHPEERDKISKKNIEEAKKYEWGNVAGRIGEILIKEKDSAWMKKKYHT